MDGGAYVNSIDAVRDFRAALATFVHEAKEAIGSHDLELRRSLQWLLEEQPQFWRKEIRRLDDAVTQAKIELERRLNTRLPGGETPGCMEERKLLERARARRQRGEETSAAIRGYGFASEREAEEYSARSRQFTDLLEADLPRAIATLDRVLDALESYVATSSATAPGMASFARTRAAPTESTPVSQAGGPTDQRAADSGNVPEPPNQDEHRTRLPEASP